MNDPAPLRHLEVDTILSFPAEIQRWLDVEAALARACAAAGLIDPEDAEAVATACRVERIDLVALDAAAATAATPIIPLVRQLEAAVPEHARSAVHYGATSQDILDTAAILALRDWRHLVSEELVGSGRRCAELAQAERNTVMAGRTLLQQAVPVTFGLKSARWLTALARQLDRLHDLRLPVQLGSAAGTLAPYGQRGIEVLTGFARELNLDVPTVPWHAERDDLHAFVAAMALVAGTCGKIAGDLVLLTQTELAEVVDGGAGGSSTMPHKRNPVDATFAVAAARLATAGAAAVLTGAGYEHERGAGGWQAEWASVPRVMQATAVAAGRVRRALEHLEVNRLRMRENLARSGEQFAAEPLALLLSEELGRRAAHGLVSELAGRAAAEGRSLIEIAAADPRVTDLLQRGDVQRLADPAAYLGSTSTLIDRALNHWHGVNG